MNEPASSSATRFFDRPLRIEWITLLASVLFTLLCNGSFWKSLLELRDFSGPGGWFLVVCIGVLITGLHWFILLLFCNRWTVKPVLIVVVLLTVGAVYFMSRYQVYFNREMIRNILETDVKEASELLSWRLLPWLVPAAGISWLIGRLNIRRSTLGKAVLWRAGSLTAALAMVGLSLWPVMKEMLPILRAHKELRYLVTPANYIVSSVRVLSDSFSSPASDEPRRVLDPNPRQNSHAAGRKPVVVVVVVGETVRAQNWGLNGYERQTTPMLAGREVINFSNFTSAGTDTATSLPAMFSLNGRHDYNREEIVGSESLLHLLNRAGVTILWRDNQSGDKGVDEGLPYENMAEAGNPALANGNRYFDEILLDDLDTRIASMEGDALIVLHMLGNHGPAYFERYPDAFRRWTPTCDSTDLAQATHEAIVNTYDNAILYTDYVLAKAIDLLSGIPDHDTALLYVSDHGESLGENGVYLHGLPMWIAPEEQTHVPMFIWMSPQFATSQGIDLQCLQARSGEPASHDYLFHTILDLLDVETSVYAPEWDLVRNCREARER
jgi:lipid A ethanolaminephosphotransferase